MSALILISAFLVIAAKFALVFAAASHCYSHATGKMKPRIAVPQLTIISNSAMGALTAAAYLWVANSLVLATIAWMKLFGVAS